MSTSDAAAAESPEVIEKPGANSSLPEVDSPTVKERTDATSPPSTVDEEENGESVEEEANGESAAAAVIAEAELNSSLPDVTTPKDVAPDEKSNSEKKDDGVSGGDLVKRKVSTSDKPTAAEATESKGKSDEAKDTNEAPKSEDVPAKSSAANESPQKESKSSEDVHLIALLNRKSGAGKGLVAWEELSERQKNCTTVDILDFAKADTSVPDGKLRDLIDQHPNCRLIVGGGDGTVTWAFEILDRIQRSPPVAALPLGTANELSGCIGWSNADNGKRLTKYTHNVRTGELTDIDLWKVEYLDDNDGDDKVELPPRRPGTMIAFLSFGLDANIAHKFHLSREARKSTPSIIGSKMVYLKFGAQEIRKPSKKLNGVIDIKVDGDGLKRECARSYRCLQVLNINSMADGVDFFGAAKSNDDDVLQEGDYTPPKLNDGKLEVVGTKTVHQMNFLRANVGHSLRLAQGKLIEFTVKEPTPLEVDGEAWINPKGVVRVTHLGSRDIVIGPKNTSSVRRGVIRKNAASASSAASSTVSVLCA